MQLVATPERECQTARVIFQHPSLSTLSACLTVSHIAQKSTVIIFGGTVYDVICAQGLTVGVDGAGTQLCFFTSCVVFFFKWFVFFRSQCGCGGCVSHGFHNPPATDHAGDRKHNGAPHHTYLTPFVQLLFRNYPKSTRAAVATLNQSWRVV